MPDYRIERDNHRVVAEVRGTYSYDVALARMRRLQADPDFDPTFSLLMDFREATAVELNHDQVAALSKIHLFAADSRRAYLVATPLQFGLARMFATYRSPTAEDVIRVFTGLNEAVAWLDQAKKPAPERKA
jgi:hypothetical protein